MKKLIVTTFFSISAVISNAQISVPKCNSYTENKELAQVIFNTVNSYRNQNNQQSFIWSNYWYQSSLKWNNFLSKNALWGHRNGPEWEWINGSELICGVTLPKTFEINSSTYKYIADSCLNQWIHSPMHHAALKAPVRTAKQTSCTLDLNGDGKLEPFNVELCSYGAISVNINEYATSYIVQIIFHLGYGIDKDHFIKDI
jgi:hypothetical protein